MSQMAIERQTAALLAPPKMTYEEFLEWAEEDSHAEWVDGEVVFMSPVSNAHQEISGFLLSLLREFVEVHQLGKLRYESFQMKLISTPRGREPDILFVGNANLSRLQSNFLNGPADLVVEIISPENVERDRVKKFAEYQLGGVREYWLIDASTCEADFFVLDERGRYQSVRADAEGIYHSAALTGFWMREAWLWQSPLPLMSVIRKELDLP